MLVSHRKRFIYTKTLKTAGTSTEVFFEPYCMPDGQWHFSHARDEYVSETGIIGVRGDRPINNWYHHMPALRIMELIGKDIWDDYFKFCVIRNPFDKLVSAFHYFKTKGLIDPDKLSRNETDEEQFRFWISTQSGALTVLDRDKYTINNEVCCDYFIRYEKLEIGIKDVCDSVGVEFHPNKLMRLKSQFRPQNKTLNNYYDSCTQAIVQEIFEFEIEKFGYHVP
ncbi:MAG: hypothetical protein IPN81_05720 [Nitrosomonadales bacterium]|nr:hypothetical protein [Nitrosomonadales bacterium]